MIEHVWTIPCRVCTIDRDTNNVSLIEVMEQLTLQIGPKQTTGIPASFEVVTLWARAEEDQPTAGHGRLSLVAPNGELLFQKEYAVDLTEYVRTRNRGRVVGFPARGSGRYDFRVERRLNEVTDWETVGTVPLTVRVAEQAETEPANEVQANASANDQ